MLMIKVVVKVPHRDLQEVLCDLTSDLVWWFCSMCNQLLQCYKNISNTATNTENISA